MGKLHEETSGKAATKGCIPALEQSTADLTVPICIVVDFEVQTRVWECPVFGYS